jgi:hypothetical protein
MDETLIRLPDFARGSLSDLRMKLGLPSTDGVSRSACRAGLEHNRAECGVRLIVFEPMAISNVAASGTAPLEASALVNAGLNGPRRRW